MKKGWDKYATEKRYIKKGYLRKYRNGNRVWKTPETGGCDCVQQSRESQEKEVAIQVYGKVVLLTEEVIYTGEENESEVRLGEQIQSGGESSSQVGSGESSSGSSKSRNGKVRKRKDGKDGTSRKKKG